MDYKITVITPDDTHEIECADDQYILDAIEDADIDISLIGLKSFKVFLFAFITVLIIVLLI